MTRSAAVPQVAYAVPRLPTFDLDAALGAQAAGPALRTISRTSNPLEGDRGRGCQALQYVEYLLDAGASPVHTTVQNVQHVEAEHIVPGSPACAFQETVPDSVFCAPTRW